MKPERNNYISAADTVAAVKAWERKKRASQYEHVLRCARQVMKTFEVDPPWRDAYDYVGRLVPLQNALALIALAKALKELEDET